MKSLLKIQRSESAHWVGDGFPVRTIFSYDDLAPMISPFLLLDYGGPAEFPPSQHIRGVGPHPHRGFETVTIVYSGEIDHRDSSGNGGHIGPGDVQWMTAASGVVHEEMHGGEFAKKGGLFEVVQLWVNLPKKNKGDPPRYQTLLDSQIPVRELNKTRLRIIAGEYDSVKGPALTHTPMNLWDIRMQNGAREIFKVPANHTAAVFVLNGAVKLNSSEQLTNAELAVLNPSGDTFELTALSDAKLLFLGGEAINEPIVGRGPFVMNTIQEIQQAYVDYHNGKMGRLQ